MSRFKAATHVLAAGLGAVVAFLVSPAGQALVGQYRWAAIASAAILTAAGVYHAPATK
ncbi:MAG TPA: hypothetical protein VMH00_00510 [Candidatus Limnocylindrales bacterium]|nr:hypothetical protein [Candidatus Limnocylindrales bacterium]